MEDRVEIVQSAPHKAGPGKPYGGQPIFEVPGSHVGLTRLSPKAVTPWHHHGACNFYGYVIEGTVTLEFGAGGRNVEHVEPGQFLRIPPHLIHRDVNQTEETVLIATICVGEGPMSVVLDGPTP